MIALLLSMIPHALPVVEGAQPSPALHTLQDEEIPDKRPEVKELTKKLLAHTKKRGDEDAQAVQIIERLSAEFKRSGPVDKKLIVTEITRAMRVKRPFSRDGARIRVLFLAGAGALGKMAPESVASLIRLVTDKNHKDDYEVRSAILAALGQTKDEKAVKTLTKELDEFNPQVQAAAAEALGQFTNLDHKKRKAIFEDLLKLLMSAQADHQSDPNGMTSSDRWRRVQGPCQRSMTKLSGANAGSPNNWQRWWNKNKRRNWDKTE
ncbi:MAG: HEAT repeat domain-containing protein [Planctomycetes bacterium]|nr:HEAT repeat domain-containing protein [Planctomycetota bacterium]